MMAYVQSQRRTRAWQSRNQVGVTTDFADFTDETFSIRDIREIRGQKIFAKTKDFFLQWYGSHG
jgi:hypothetical protein